MPDWPQKKYDYKPKLHEKKLRKVAIQHWRVEPETDKQGNHKVFEVEGYPGMFVDSNVAFCKLEQNDRSER